MKRSSALRSGWHASPRKILASLGVVLLGAGGVLASGASFTSTSGNRANVITAGILSQTNSASHQAVLSAANMAPGASANGSLDITNSGDVPARMVLRLAGKQDTPPSPPLSAKLQLVVDDLGNPSCTSSCPAAITKYSGALGAMPGVSLGILAPTAKHRYRFRVTYPDGGAGGADNAYAGATTTVDFAWEADQ